MKRKIIFILLFNCFGFVSTAFCEDPNCPKWQENDSWKVRTWYSQGGFSTGDSKTKSEYIRKGTPVDVVFRVEKNVNIKDKTCYSIQVIFPKESSNFQRRYQLFFEKETCRLIRIVDKSIRIDGTIKNIITDFNDNKDGPVFVSDISSLIPFDFPDFKSSAYERIDNKAVRIQKINKRILKQKGKKDQTEKDVEESEITMELNKPGKHIVNIQQNWRKGEPWWRESKKIINGEIVAEAILLVDEEQ